MNLLQLVLKQMRQRALSSWLTLLSVVLGVALAVVIMILRRGGEGLFGQTDYGYDVLVGARGSDLSLVMNTVYQVGNSPGNIPYGIYDQMTAENGTYYPFVRSAVPCVVGDNYKGMRIIGTSTKLFGVAEDGKPLADNEVIEYRPGRRYALASGSIFAARKFEAVIGSDVPMRTGLKIGDPFKATHNATPGSPAVHEHDERWTVVGILQPTHTAADRSIYIPLVSFYAVGGHEEALEERAKVKAGADPGVVASEKAKKTPGHEEHEDHEEHYTLTSDGSIELKLPKDEWELSAILVKSRSMTMGQNLLDVLRLRNEAGAVNPASVMAEFFRSFLSNAALVLLVISLLVTVVAGVSILVSIYNSVSARLREIAILRALGATRRRIVALICLEAGLIGLAGGIIGIAAGHAIAAAASHYLSQTIGEGFNWVAVGPEEWIYLIAVVAVSVLAGLVPALKAYGVPVATNLAAQ